MKYTEADMERVIEAAFRMGFADALSELDGDLTPVRPRPSPSMLYSVLRAGERDGQVSRRSISLESPAKPRGPGNPVEDSTVGAAPPSTQTARGASMRRLILAAGIPSALMLAAAGPGFGATRHDH